MQHWHGESNSKMHHLNKKSTPPINAKGAGSLTPHIGRHLTAGRHINIVDKAVQIKLTACANL